MNGDRGWVRSPEALWRDVAGGIVITRQGRDEVDELSTTAAAGWLLLGEPTTADQLTRRLAEMFNASAEDIQGDVEALLVRLSSEGWIQEVPAR